jgi:hypothetical protein
MRKCVLAIAVLAGTAAVPPAPAVGIDHVLFTGGSQLSTLVELLRTKWQLPVMFDGPASNPPMPGTCFSFGNTCLEVVPLRNDSGASTRSSRIGNLALRAARFEALGDTLTALGIDHFPPAVQSRWTTVGLRGIGSVGFFIDYPEGMEQRRRRFRAELDARQGGPLGIVRMREVSRMVEQERDTVRQRWNRLFGPARQEDPYLWPVGDGPSIRMVAPGDSLADRIVVEVRSLADAAAALRRLEIPFSETGRAIVIDARSLSGLRMVLVAR